MGLMKPRVSSYVDRGNELIAKGKTKQAMNLVSISRSCTRNRRLWKIYG